MTFERFEPETQIAFPQRLLDINALHLGPALAPAVASLEITELDTELARYVPHERLGRVAAAGLRGERLFPVPLVLQKAPRLIGYYRLLYGISQKSFYREFGPFKSMEDRGNISARALPDLASLCASLCETAWLLVENVADVDAARIRDLQLLTLGAQLRGGHLNKIGRVATAIVFKRIRAAIADSAIEEEDESYILVRNASALRVRIQFSTDPDIAISMELTSGFGNRLAVEIKGGTDVSNVHNRLGEAEKSHQKAQEQGFTEFWTIVNAPVDEETARRESPTTQEFFQLSEIIDPSNSEWVRFRDELTSRLGIPAAS